MAVMSGGHALERKIEVADGKGGGSSFWKAVPSAKD
jgi:hypothetical protein